MAESSKRSSRPAPTARQTATDTSRQSKARNASDAEGEDDEEDDEEEETTWSEMIKQSPSWLASMIFHMILLLVLALWTYKNLEDNLQELTIGDPDIVEEELLDEAEEEVNPEEEEVESDTQEEVEEITSPIDTEVEAETPQIQTNENDLTLAAAQVEISDFGAESVMSGDVLGNVSGLSASGLGSRSSAGRAGAVRKGGGSKGSESAVEAALKWLAEHQNRDGSWSFNHTEGDNCSGFPNPGTKSSRMGATGLALLPFLGAGYTHQEGKYEYVVKKGLKYLVGNMIVANNMGRLYEKNGESHSHMYCHGIAACALAEAYGMTNDSKLKAPAQLSLNYIVAAQHPENGGWLYEPRQGGDTSVVGWQVMALKSGVLSYLQVPGNVKALANRWLDSVQWGEAESGGAMIKPHYGYRAPSDREAASACTAIGLLCRNYLGASKDDGGLRAGVRTLSNKGPEGSDMYYNYYSSMVMYQNDGPKGDMWTKWNGVMRDQLVNSQVQDGKEKGSWFFAGGHGSDGGRLYNTCLCAMTLEVYYRYLPIYNQKNVEQDDFPID
ncbi:MAG: prenyltransferase/squalene oxidase repeat-containing protein [Pirellulales bacterium]